MPSYLPYLIAGLVVFTVVVIVIGLRYNKNTSSKFTDQHPDAATIYLTSAKGAVAASFAMNDMVAIVGVDGVYMNMNAANDIDVSSANLVVDKQRGAALFLNQMSKVMIVPGQHTLALVAKHSRPGVMARTVTTSYGPVEVNVMLEPHKEYQLTFDRDTQQFGLTERPA